MEYTFKNGETIKLKRLNRRIVRSIFAPLGGLSVAMNMKEADIAEMSEDERREYANINSRFFTYCAGWGVADDPPSQDRKVLLALSYDPEQIHLFRSAWVQFCLLGDDSTDDDAGDFLGTVLTYTFSGDE